jgi:hypothetical protein
VVVECHNSNDKRAVAPLLCLVLERLTGEMATETMPDR